MGALPEHIILCNDVQLPRVGLGTFRSKGPDVATAVTCALNNHIEHVDTASIYKVTLAHSARPRVVNNLGPNCSLAERS